MPYLVQLWDMEPLPQKPGNEMEPPPIIHFIHRKEAEMFKKKDHINNQK